MRRYTVHRSQGIVANVDQFISRGLRLLQYGDYLSLSLEDLKTSECDLEGL